MSRPAAAPPPHPAAAGLNPPFTTFGDGSPWLPPGTDSTWVCRCGGVNPRTATTCQRCGT